jgi:hypothetical protein
MEQEEEYQGYRIRVATTRAADGTWRSAATIAGSDEAIAEEAGHASEAEAKRAILSAAMATLDRQRARTGKP